MDPLLAFIVGAGVAVAVTCMVVYVVDPTRNGRIQGRRLAYKQAIEVARERADVSLYLAPEGELSIGLIRARAAHDIELTMRELLAKLDRENP
jgi:hypothetical protein